MDGSRRCVDASQLQHVGLGRRIQSCQARPDGGGRREPHRCTRGRIGQDRIGQDRTGLGRMVGKVRQSRTLARIVRTRKVAQPRRGECSNLQSTTHETEDSRRCSTSTMQQHNGSQFQCGRVRKCVKETGGREHDGKKKTRIARRFLEGGGVGDQSPARIQTCWDPPLREASP